MGSLGSGLFLAEVSLFALLQRAVPCAQMALEPGMGRGGCVCGVWEEAMFSAASLGTVVDFGVGGLCTLGPHVSVF